MTVLLEVAQPTYPEIDRLMTKTMREIGHHGRRHGDRTVLARAVTDLPSSDVRYARPVGACLLGWCTGVENLNAAFRDWAEKELPLGGLEDTRYAAHWVADLALLEDCLAQGCAHLETRRIMERFLMTQDLRQRWIDCLEAVEPALNGHQGEVWLTGFFNVDHSAGCLKEIAISA